MKGSGKKSNMVDDSVEASAEDKSCGGDPSENGGDDSIPGEEKGGGEEDEGQEERPKLDEGFFEIEAIRRKRVRKGQHQYLIKWRGWPETANTWEPLDNLLSCSDVVDVFEESLKSGKRGRKRKQKQKYGDLNSQSKKKQPRSTSTSHNSADAVTSVDNHVYPALLKNSCLAVHQLNGSNCIGESNGGISNDSTFHRAGDHAALTGLKESYREKQENKYDPKLIELRETTSSNKLSNSIQEGNSLEGGDLPNGTLKESCLGPAQNNHCRGAKKRKSGSVKRFKQDSTSCSAVLCPSLMPDFALDSSFGTISRLGTEVPGATENSSSQKQKTEELNIMKILRPMSFSASLPDDEVLVTFLALRSDGKEVMVDNRFLKAQNPLLLIDFYEQHLKYNTTS